MVAGIDEVELFSSTKKSCPDCLTRKNRAGKTEYFHRSVVCMTVGKAPHVILGQEMLKPRGTLCALGSKRVTAASRMSEEHIFYKNA